MSFQDFILPFENLKLILNISQALKLKQEVGVYNIMSLFSTILEIAPKPVAKFITSTPTQYLLSYVLQSIFFSLAITSLLTALLKLISFSYAKAIFNNSIAKIILAILFMYIKIWQQSNWFIFIGYACGLFVGLYVYDCGMSIGELYVERVHGWYWYQVAGYVIVAMVLPFVAIPMYVKDYQPVLYIGLAVEILVICARTAFKNKHIIFSAIPALIILTVPLFRHLRSLNPYIQNLPLQTLPLIMMAFDAEYKQHKKIQQKSINKQPKNQKSQPQPQQHQKQSIIFQILKSCVAFILYVCLNGKAMYLEHVIAAVWIIVEFIKYS